MIDLLLDMAPRWALSHAPALLIMVPLFLAPLLARRPVQASRTSSNRCTGPPRWGFR